MRTKSTLRYRGYLVMLALAGGSLFDNSVASAEPAEANATAGDEEPAMLIIKPSKALKNECPSGWVLMVWDDMGTVHASSPGAALTVPVAGTWHGWAGIAAQCAGRFWKDWSPFLGRTARQAGFASITINGFELSTPHSLVCHDPWGPGDKPMIPLDAPNFGKCP